MNMIRHALVTSFGDMTIFSDDGERLVALALPDKEDTTRAWLKRHYKGDTVRDGKIAAAEALKDYFAGDLQAIYRVRWRAVGTPFQMSVWNALYKIPIGTTRTYAAISAEIGRPTAVRAVGAANGANPIAVVVPCHRVIGSDGSLTGFGGGLQLKKQLLGHEGVSLSAFETATLFD